MYTTNAIVSFGKGYGQYYPEKDRADLVCNDFLEGWEKITRMWLLYRLPVDENGTYNRCKTELTAKWKRKFASSHAGCDTQYWNDKEWNSIAHLAEYETLYKPDTDKDRRIRAAILKIDDVAFSRKETRECAYTFVKELFCSEEFMYFFKLKNLPNLRLVCKGIRKIIDYKIYMKHVEDITEITTRKNMLYQASFSDFLEESELDDALKAVLLGALKTAAVVQGSVSFWSTVAAVCINPSLWRWSVAIGGTLVVGAVGAFGGFIYLGSENIKRANKNIKKSDYDEKLKSLFKEHQFLKGDLIYSQFADDFLEWKTRRIHRNYETIKALSNEDKICDIDEDLKCCITEGFIKIPGIADNDGIPFEYEAIEGWLKVNHIHPVTGDHTTLSDLRFDTKRFYKSRAIINLELKEQKWQLEQ